MRRTMRKQCPHHNLGLFPKLPHFAFKILPSKHSFKDSSHGESRIPIHWACIFLGSFSAEVLQSVGCWSSSDSCRPPPQFHPPEGGDLAAEHTPLQMEGNSHLKGWFEFFSSSVIGTKDLSSAERKPLFHIQPNLERKAPTLCQSHFPWNSHHPGHNPWMIPPVNLP